MMGCDAALLPFLRQQKGELKGVQIERVYEPPASRCARRVPLDAQGGVEGGLEAWALWCSKV